MGIVGVCGRLYGDCEHSCSGADRGGCKKEKNKEADIEEGSSTEDLVPQQVPVLQAAMPAAPRF